MEAIKELRGSPPIKDIKTLMALDDVKLFFKILHGDSTTKFKGFYCLSNLEPCQKAKDKIKIINYFSMYNSLNDELIIEKIINKKDVYITPNTFKQYRRNTENLYQIRCLYVDLDVENVGLHKFDVYSKLLEMIDKKEIPPPTMVIDSGRGYHLYFRIKDSNPNKVVLDMWKKTENRLIELLKSLGADDKAKDLARILRVPTTVNSKNNSICKMISWDENLIYSLSDLKNFCFKNAIKDTNKTVKKKIKKVEKVSNNSTSSKNKKFIGDYKTLNQSAIEDLEKLLKLRNYKLTNCRNSFLFIYAVYLNLLKYHEEAIYIKLTFINSSLKEPLQDFEIRNTSHSVIIKKEDDLKEGNKEITQLSKYKDNVPTQGYKFSSKKIIEHLSITKEEMQELNILIDEEEIKRRKNSKRKADRRGKDNLTDKQREQLEKKEKALAMKEQGFTLRAISKEFKCSLSTIQNLLK